MICGAQKAGTTALADYLRLHPKIHIPARKEIHFFDSEHYNWSAPPYWQYHRSYRYSDYGEKWGDATPITMYWESAPARIWRYNPNMKLIVSLRNPISRAYSHWRMEYTRGRDKLKFEEALKIEQKRSRECLPVQDKQHSYVDRGYYAHQIKRLWRFFGKENVLVLRQEDLIKNSKECLNSVCELLEIEPMPVFSHSLSRVGTKEKPMSRWAKSYLHECFDGEIRTLEKMLKWNCRQWLRY